jgi:YcxB-like protein
VLVCAEFFDLKRMEHRQKIEVEVNAKAANYRRILFWYHWKRILAVAIVYLVVAPTMVWFVAFGAGTNPFDEKNKDIFLIFGIFAVLPILLGFSIYFGIFRQAKKIEKIAEKVIFAFDEDGLETKSESISSQIKWDRFVKICETKKDFIFFPQENIFYTVPKISFKNDEQINNFKDLIREKLGEKAKLKNNS